MKDVSGVKWTDWPLRGAVGAGRQDPLTPDTEEFVPTPSAFAAEETAEEVPDAGSE